MSEAGVIICVSDIIMLSTLRFNRSRSPDIAVHLIAKTFSTIAFTFLGNRLSGQLCIDTGFTEEVS